MIRKNENDLKDVPELGIEPGSAAFIELGESLSAKNGIKIRN